MSIQSEIGRITANIARAYAACGELGAQLPELRDSAHLEEAIRAIKTGGEFAVPLRVTADVGATITATLGDETISGLVSDTGNVVLTLPSPGIWTISGTLNGVEKSSELEVITGYEKAFSLTSRVPEEYVELEYVELSKTTTGITGISATTGATRVVMEMMPLEKGSQTTYMIFQGHVKNATGYSFEVQLRQFFNSSQFNTIGLWWRSGRTSGDSAASNKFAYTFEANKKVQIDFAPQNGKIIVGDTVVDTSSYSTGYSQNVTLYIGEYVNHSSGYYTYPMRLYSMQIYVKDELKGDFIPCKRLADNKIGLFNTVNHQFVSAIYGTYIAGPEV